MGFNKKIFFAAMIVIALAIEFWTGSRYPSLNEKAAMAGSVPLSDTLSFEAVLEFESTDPLWQRISYSTVNWIETNRNGMTFGVLFGGAFLTLLTYFRRRRTKSAFLNSIIGMLTGAPLGVCVNCAAPIARGMFRSGSSVETSLAAMLSSPTLNVVVVTMLFSLFPPYMIVIKLGLTLLVVVLLLPVMSKYFFTVENNLICANNDDPKAASSQLQPITWRQAIFEVGRDFTKNFWFILKTTVPLMFIAGFLGVCATQIFSFDSIVTSEPTLIGLVFASMLGVFLPAPIALDVVLAQAFLVAGFPKAYVMTFLFTLGIYSIYSCFIVWTSISKKVALTMYATITVLGVGAGYIAQNYHEWDSARALEYYEQRIEDGLTAILGSDTAYGAAERSLKSAKPNFSVERGREPVVVKGSVAIYGRNHARRQGDDGKPFTLIPAGKVGLYRPMEFSVLDFFPPFYNGRGIASGDFNGDGWQDVAVATQAGIKLYKNLGNGQFTEHPLRVLGNKGFNVILVAFVDIDNNGWLDLYATTYGQGRNYFYLNDGKGKFQSKPIRVPNPNAKLTKSTAFADIDRDGDLDFINGNWFMGFATPIPPEMSRNYLVINNDMRFRQRTMTDQPGETLSTLFSDFNMDGRIDLAVGNDFSVPDFYYYGNGKGGFRQLSAGHNIPHSTTTTMSIDTADFNNDLKLDMYIGQITGTFQTGGNLPEIDFDLRYCSRIASTRDKAMCEMNIKAKKITLYSEVSLAKVRECKSLGPKRIEVECMTQVLFLTAIKEKKPELCKKIATRFDDTRQMCLDFFAKEPSPQIETKREAVAQIEKRNILLLQGKSGQFDDVTEKMKVAMTGWTWNAKFADLDNDGYQDIYAANGTWLQKKVHSNVFFHNRGGKLFAEQTQEFGLEDYNVVGSYTYIDIDGDGDLDIVSLPVNGTMKLFRNNNRNHNSITFALRDHKGNSHCVGCKVYIYYGKGQHQVRELKVGGGFHAFDASIAHFGLKDVDKIKRLVVEWADGSKWQIKNDLASDRHYDIVRH